MVLKKPQNPPLRSACITDSYQQDSSVFKKHLWTPPCSVIHDVETDRVAKLWSRPGSDNLQDRLELSMSSDKNWNLPSVLQHLLWHVPPVSFPAGTQNSSFSSFAPSSSRKLFSSVSSPQSLLRTVTVDVLVWDRDEQFPGRSLLLPHHHCSSRFAGTGRAHAVLPQISCHLLEGPGVTKPNWQLAVIQKAQSYTQAKPHCQVNFIYKHTNSWMTVLKAPGPQAPKTDQHLFECYKDNYCKHHPCFSPSPLKGKHSWVWIPQAKFCMIWYPPTGDKLLAELKFGCAVFRAPGPAVLLSQCSADVI